MATISRPGTETLRLEDCPCCGGDVSVSDCGYSSFNPGTAKCSGECGVVSVFEFKLGHHQKAEAVGKRDRRPVGRTNHVQTVTGK